jgi:hypothetical protein
MGGRKINLTPGRGFCSGISLFGSIKKNFYPRTSSPLVRAVLSFSFGQVTGIQIKNHCGSR